MKLKKIPPSLLHVSGAFSASKKSFPVRCPLDGKVVANFPESGKNDTVRAIESAEAAFQSFRWTTGNSRGAILSKWAMLIKRHRVDLANIIRRESGKPITEALVEVDSCVEYFRWFSGAAPRLIGETIPSPNAKTRHWTIREPLGCVGMITPWNFPMAMLARKLSAAIAAGCTVVAKPSELTPFSAVALVNLGFSAGVPSGAISIISGNASVIGDELCQHPAIRQISFTGSTNVGKIIQQKAVGKRLAMELGGNAPFVVCADAHLEDAVNALMQSKFRNAGQTCVAPNRVLVAKSLYPGFKKRLLGAMQRVGFTSHTNVETLIGPVISAKHHQRIKDLVKTACEHGARRIHVHKYVPPGHYYPPTVLENVSSCNPVWHAELFGPVIMLSCFENDAEAIRLANDSEYGLAAYVFTRSISRAVLYSEKLDSGMVGINAAKLSNSATPFGGKPGFGKEGGTDGINEYINLKLCTQWI